MRYVGTVIRPPSEAHSIILQVTIGCSYNKCTFCGAYKDTPFQVKNEAAIQEDLEYASLRFSDCNKVFLADGDALILPQGKLVALLRDIRKYLPGVNRISTYANARAIRSKSIDELKELKDLGLHRIYLGLESGDDEILHQVKKGETSASMIEASKKVHAAGLFLSVTVLLGLAQLTGSISHAVKTAQTINTMHPQQTALLSLMPLPNTEIGRLYAEQKFHLLTPEETLLELQTLVQHLDVTTLFFANHASNYLPLSGKLPRDTKRILGEITDALYGNTQLVPETLRRL